MLSGFPSTGNPVKRFPPEDKKIPTTVQFPAEPKTEQWQEFLSWQRVKDSNPHIQSQSLLCYLYTNPLYLSASANRYYYTEKRDFVKSIFQLFKINFSRQLFAMLAAEKTLQKAAFLFFRLALLQPFQGLCRFLKSLIRGGPV